MGPELQGNECKDCHVHGTLAERIRAMKEKQKISCDEHILLWNDMKGKVGYIIFIPLMIIMVGATGFVVKGQIDNAKTIARIDERTQAIPLIQETLHEHILTQQAVLNRMRPPGNLHEKRKGE